jgi:hypothetical protein
MMKNGDFRGRRPQPEKTTIETIPMKKFLEVSEPFFKKVLTRRRQKLTRLLETAVQEVIT